MTHYQKRYCVMCSFIAIPRYLDGAFYLSGASCPTLPSPTYRKYIGCKAKRQWVHRNGCAIAGAIDGAIAPNAPACLRAWVQNNFGRALLLPSREDNIKSQGAAVQHNFRRAPLLPSREDNINSLGAAVQHNFRRALLLPSREENINSLGAAVQHNFSPHAAGVTYYGFQTVCKCPFRALLVTSATDSNQT